MTFHILKVKDLPHCVIIMFSRSTLLDFIQCITQEQQGRWRQNVFKWKKHYNHTVHSVFRALHSFHILLYCSLVLKLIFNLTRLHSPYTIITRGKQNFTSFCKCIKKEKTEVSQWHKYSDSLLWHLAHFLDHLWDVSPTWLESTCGKLNWFDMFWEGTHLSI